MTGSIYYVAKAKVIFSHVKISHEVFARKLTWYFIGVYIIKRSICWVSWCRTILERLRRVNMVKFSLQDWEGLVDSFACDCCFVYEKAHHDIRCRSEVWLVKLKVLDGHFSLECRMIILQQSVCGVNHWTIQDTHLSCISSGHITSHQQQC